MFSFLRTLVFELFYDKVVPNNKGVVTAVEYKHREAKKHYTNERANGMRAGTVTHENTIERFGNGH